MTLECGIRFLSDYLDGDNYFKIHREHHNLDRARTQFKLVWDMEQKMDKMNEIIKKDGVIISEYVIGTKPLAKNFPKRNRIISALGNGLIVVEAREKSGTLITVDFALEQGKDVIHLSVGSGVSQGSVNGAHLIANQLNSEYKNKVY